jgi:putative nucleotidyltransferase with HDIG domain
MLSAMLDQLSQRDRATARHSAAVARYARELCRAAGGSEAMQQLAHTAGLLHDIGKTRFPKHIFAGDRKLSSDDWETIRRHPEWGAELILQIPGFASVAEIVLCHHERPDGRGYPHGLRAAQIPFLSRILSVADTYDVMTARDSYRKPRTRAAATAELRRVSGTQLDRGLVTIFARTLEREKLTCAHSDLAVLMELRLAAGAAPRWAAEGEALFATVAAA